VSSGGFAFYSLVFGGSAALSLLLTPLALRFATRGRFFDLPTPTKGHKSPVPYLGGLAIVSAFALVIAGAALIRPPDARLDELLIVLGVGVVLSFVGFLDDLRNLSPVLRFGVEVAAGVIVYLTGIGVDLFSNGAVNGVFTVLWVVGITNAFNLLDNMDGLSAGVAVIGAGWFFVIGAVNGQFLVAALAAALAGCAIGFLRHNFHPARIYMGDAGSLFLGFMLAVLGVKLRFDGPTNVTFLVPMLVLGMAILDTSLVTICRLRARRSPFQGGLDHTSHRLVFIGIPVPVAVALVYGGAFGLGVIALVVSRVDRLSAYLLAALMVLGGAFVMVLLARVPVYRGREAWRTAVETGELSVDLTVCRTRQARLGRLLTPGGVTPERAEAGRST
jgi:UDP-GlcNAc:undecaprenyl-phosphate/decaprenyl-phosphate GlcNAc-1-phosphate transferase